MKRAIVRHASTKARGANVNNARLEFHKDQIYGESFQDPQAQDAKRIAALKQVIPNLEAHETIERAWKLYSRNQREAHELNMQKRFESVKSAMDQLKEISPRLYAAAAAPSPDIAASTKGEQGQLASLQGRIPGLFPRQLRIPTETLPSSTVDAFDENWKRPADLVTEDGAKPDPNTS